MSYAKESFLKRYLIDSRQIRNLLGMMVALVVTDGLLSQFLLTQRLAWEGNPFMRTLIGEGSFLSIKVAAAVLSAIILWYIYKKRPMMAIVGVVSSVILYTGIVYWNLSVFFISQV